MNNNKDKQQNKDNIQDNSKNNVNAAKDNNKAENPKVIEDKLNKEIKELKATIEKNNLRIKELESQINKFNSDYKNELSAKERLAQQKVEQKIKEYQEKFEKDLNHVKKYALKDKAADLINIISNFESAVSSEVKDQAVANYLKGFQMFCSMFKNYLEDNNIKEIKINVNDDFNEKLMHAFETKKVENVSPNKVLKIVKKGYMLHDIVIAPAVVIVSK
ncbi:MAG: nucleotide exchange factor GrpE [Mycoplasma sp.]|nr:nucleotide exchange factor GrpE [Mycoplasma sp.]